MPSLTYNKEERHKFGDTRKWQLSQLGRIIDLDDPLITIIFICVHTDNTEFEMINDFSSKYIFPHKAIIIIIRHKVPRS